ncbi:MAG TPA: diaminopimelate epimerase [Coriobacteriia bacterium]
MDLTFTKMHGCGNDFIVVDDRAREWDLDETAVEMLCDRHFGIGADGMILVRPATDPAADFYMHYINADGSLAEMCGNGIRVFAKYLVDRGFVTSGRLVVQTLGGLKPIEIVPDQGGAFALARVDMGEPVLEAAGVPTTLANGRVIEAPLVTEAGTVAVTCVSMGNPHAIIWVDDVENAPVDTIGPEVEVHAAFPRHTNVEFAQLIGPSHIRLRVWERGVGETLACGTGACATLVAAVLTDRCGRSAIVDLPGGELRIEWPQGGHVYMTGPAEQVYEGVYPIPDRD